MTFEMSLKEYTGIIQARRPGGWHESMQGGQREPGVEIHGEDSV